MRGLLVSVVQNRTLGLPTSRCGCILSMAKRVAGARNKVSWGSVRGVSMVKERLVR
jgi:hypothetical protein